MAKLIAQLAEAQQLRENLQKAFQELSDFWTNADHSMVDHLLNEDYPFGEDFGDVNYKVRVWAGMPRE